MKKTLIVIDMQNDFIDGTLGTSEAVAIVENVKAKIEEYKAAGDEIIFTRDTHGENYLDTPEGKKLPVVHCVKGTQGWEIISNALILKAFFPEVEITVDASCCAGVTPETHNAALAAMKMCQINVIGA